MQQTKIEWATHTWNPVVGCSFGCSFGCYAHRFAERGMGEYGKHPKGERFRPRFLPERLEEPLKRKKPSRIFACSMSDLFGPEIALDDIKSIFRVMSEAQQHTFITLTKRPHRMRVLALGWPRNVWAGTSITRQEDSYRLDELLQVPAAVRWVSIEPLLGEISIGQYLYRWGTYDRTLGHISWVVIGRQTGPGAVPPKREWVESLVEQCRAARVPVFEKQNLAAVLGRPLIQEYPEVSKRR